MPAMAGRACALLATVLGAAALLLALPASAHNPTPGYPGEADGHTWVANPIPGVPDCWPPLASSPLNAYEFVGPPGTCIESEPCPGIADANAGPYPPGYASPNSHVGHVMELGAYTGYGLESGSVDLWHFWQGDLPIDQEYPQNIENGGVGLGVMMGSDGFFRGGFAQTVPEDPAPGTAEILSNDVHQQRSYCFYGAKEHGGPYIFMTATWGGPMVSNTNVDMSDWYKPLFLLTYPDEPVVLNYLMMITSGFIYVPPPQIIVDPDPCIYLDPAYTGGWDQSMVQLAASVNIDWYPSTITWDFGDGTPDATGTSVSHYYADDGVFTVTVTATVPWSSDTRTVTCTMFNRPPQAVFACPELAPRVYYMVFDGSSSTDPESALDYEWDFGDGSPLRPGMMPDHQYPRRAFWDITLTVFDDDHNTMGTTNAVTSSTVTLTCMSPDRPPVMRPPPRVSVATHGTVTFGVSGYDPDDDTPLVYGSRGLPRGATFDPLTQTFTWTPTRVGLYGPIWFTITDPFGLSDEKAAWILVYDAASDIDLDGVPDSADVCPSVADHPQLDSDHDGLGDACEDHPEAVMSVAATRVWLEKMSRDSDLDGVVDASDNCPAAPNVDQADMDGDSQGDGCDADLDGDGIPNLPTAGFTAALDNCPTRANPDQGDLDGNSVGDLCEAGMMGALRAPAAAGDGVGAPAADDPGPAAMHWTANAARVTGGLLALVAVAGLVVAFVARRRR